jgi:hypothetical protein
MNLMKWFRKNRNKILAVMVVALMFVFIGGSALQRFLEGRGTSLHKTVAYFQGNKITNNDLETARQELAMLKLMAADFWLKNMPGPIPNIPDMQGMLLGELLFSDRTSSPDVFRQIKQAVTTGQYRISLKQINDIYRSRMPAQMYWLLLRNEAERAGIRFSDEQAATLYARIVTEIGKVEGRTITYSQMIGAIVARHRIPESRLLRTFAVLQAVLEYARLNCSTEDLTTGQLSHEISRAEETIDAELVKFDSAMFVDSQDEPTQEQILAHFEKYRGFSAGQASDENPYGFGYKLGELVRLEYVAVKLDDIADTVGEPTEQEKQEYYRKNMDRFTPTEPADPNDPNFVAEPRSYAEVANIISSLIVRDKKNAKAQEILLEARSLVEQHLEGLEAEPEQLSDERFRELAGDYRAIAEQLSQKHEVNVYADQTGLLNASDIAQDEYLGQMFVRGSAQSMVGLPQMVFAVDPLGVSELGPFDVPKPRMYGTIGPVRDYSERIMAIIRVIEAREAAEPESSDQTFSKRVLDLEQDPDGGKEDLQTQDSYSVRAKVVEDLKRLAAMDTAKKEAERFKLLAEQITWDLAVDNFNEHYSKLREDDLDPNLVGPPDPASWLREPFRLQQLTNLARLSSLASGTLATQREGDPAGQRSLDAIAKESKLRDKLYSLVPQDRILADGLPLVVEFKPDMSYFCLKSLLAKRVSRDRYEQMKVRQAYTQETTASQSLAAVHFNPENILTRMSFELLKEDEPPTDANVPQESS